ncbi:MAG: hypothetical protein RPS47_17930 [Colwellia sp.]|jgi:hypothetical protein
MKPSDKLSSEIHRVARDFNKSNSSGSNGIEALATAAHKEGDIKVTVKVRSLINKIDSRNTKTKLTLDEVFLLLKTMIVHKDTGVIDILKQLIDDLENSTSLKIKKDFDLLYRESIKENTLSSFVFQNIDIWHSARSDVSNKLNNIISNGEVGYKEYDDFINMLTNNIAITKSLKLQLEYLKESGKNLFKPTSQ